MPPYPQDTQAGPVINPIEPPPITPEPPLNNTPPTEKPIEKPRVALVLGGAGVASFATVGILKRLQEEGIEVDFIVSSGWPTLFSVGNCYMKSVHDLEWFAMRLSKDDFQSSGLFDSSKGFFASQEKLNALIDKSFPSKELGECQAKVPVVIAANNVPPPGDGEIYERGDYRSPLLKTMVVPGVQNSPTDSSTMARLQSVDVNEASRRGAKIVFVVEMYDDYLKYLKTAKADLKETKFRQQYMNQMRSSVSKELSLAQIKGRVSLNKSPDDYDAKRAAIVAGYKEAARMVKELRKVQPTTR